MTDLLNGMTPEEFGTILGEDLGPVEGFLRAPSDMCSEAPPANCLLAPNDLQAIKACGVTFAETMIERVIDERTLGDPAKADVIRKRIGDLIGGSLAAIKAGSDKAAPWTFGSRPLMANLAARGLLQ